MSKVVIFTDGSCLNNPGPGGWAFLIVENFPSSKAEIVFKKSGYELNSTNNRMEMTAILEAMKYSAKNFSDQKIEINSDSNLLVQSINLGWKRKANLDLWQEIDKYSSQVDFKIFWVKAHANNHFNNQCDELAQAAAQKAKKILAKNPGLLATSTPSQEISATKIKKPNRVINDQASLF